MTNRIGFNAAGKCGALAAIGAAMAIVSAAQTFTVVKRFNGTSGAGPVAPPVEGIDLNLYGTTLNGGGSNYGTIFKVNSSNHISALYNFCYLCPTGFAFSGGQGLAAGADGNLYGTTEAGGNTYNTGTVFKINTKGKLTTLYSFCAGGGYCPDGSNPESALVQGNDGNLYGTTFFGGGVNNGGTVFRISPSGALTTLYSFCAGSSACPEGAYPHGQLAQGTDGNFYGTTESGGANGQGTVFIITPQGNVITLYSFCASASCTDGAVPTSGVVEGADGNFYGTTSAGGGGLECLSGCGTVFRVTPQGTLTTLYAFILPAYFGSVPNGLVQGTDGNFYGTTSQGGALSNGTIFQITPSGEFTPLHNLTTSGGSQPLGGMMQKTDGDFYGTAYAGGTGNFGSVFRLSMGLSPFVKMLPVAAKVGYTVAIYGSNLTGTSSVTFNGIPSTFVDVLTPTLIDVTVPSGATTGSVRVTTPSGVLTSNVAFQVLP